MSMYTAEATNRSPKVVLDAETQTLLLEGESYPEDIRLHFGPLMDSLNTYVASNASKLDVTIKLTYFNSSSARALMEMLDALDDAAGENFTVSLSWYCDPDDDITREFAEDIAADMQNMSFALKDLEAH